MQTWYLLLHARANKQSLARATVYMKLPRYRIFVLFGMLAFHAGLSSCASARQPAAGPDAAHASDGHDEARIAAMMAAMTIEEKVGQMTFRSTWKSSDHEDLIRQGRIGVLFDVAGAEEANRLQRIAVEHSRLGIPLVFAADVLHGYRTIFPIPLALASTWNMDLIERTSRVMALEAAASGIHWTFAPMLDIGRDPRWGRIAESPGEDPFLASRIAVAQLRGVQGPGPREGHGRGSTLMACPKHFAGYGAVEGGRDYGSVDVSERTLRSVYLPPFQAIVRAGAACLMTSLTALNGVPSVADPFLIRDILRGEWHYEGIVISDWKSIAELVEHGVVESEEQAARAALDAGIDIDMQSHVYMRHLAKLARRDPAVGRRIDEAVRRILRAKLRLGLFDHPYADVAREQEVLSRPEHRSLAREAARQSIVLLKHDAALLPLGPRHGSIAVIGPLADDREAPLGAWSATGRPEEVVTVWDGLRAALPAGMEARHAPGCGVTEGSAADIGDAVALARRSDVAVLVLGESAAMTGEAASKANLGLPGVQQALLERIVATGTPTIVVLLSGRPLAVEWAVEHAAAVVQAWHLGVESGNAIADILLGHHTPNGKLPVTVLRSVGQVPMYYNHERTGRPAGERKYTSKYMDVPIGPLFAFGHGTSYTEFRYSDLAVHPRRIPATGRVRVQVTVTNTGAREGTEIVQLYAHDEVASVTRPVKELKGFRRVLLPPGASRRVSFELAARSLGLHDATMRYRVEPGTFRIWVGPSSTAGLASSFEVVSPASEDTPGRR